MRYRQLRLWMISAGLGWMMDSSCFVPDPTAYLRSRLDKLLGTKAGVRVSAETFLREVGKVCPLLESGSIRQRVAEYTDQPRDKYATPAVSFAVLRLLDAGLVALDSASDGSVLILELQGRSERFTSISLTTAGEKMVLARSAQ
jgi:hypothetical protein